MNYIYGFSLFLAGAFIALFGAGRPGAAWIIVAGLLFGWVAVGLYLAGVHRGMRNNDL